MTRAEFNAFCATLPAATHVVQWGGSDVWKIGGKMFAVAGRGDHPTPITFKVGTLAFEMLRDQPGLRPAPYLASRGLSWIQQHASPGLADADLRDYLRHSWALIAQGLTKKQRAELGLVESSERAMTVGGAPVTPSRVPR